MVTQRVAFPPGPKSRYYGATIVAMGRDRLGFLTDTARTYGDIAHFILAGRHTYLLSNPDDIRDVLVTHSRDFMKGRGLVRAKRVLGNGLLTSEGDFHLRQRRLAQPAFHRQRVDAYGAAMTAYATRTAGSWRDGATLDMHREMMRLTLAIVGKTLFDADVESEAAEIGDALTTMLNTFPVLMLPFGERLETLPLPIIRRFLAARSRLDATIYRLIAERRATGEDRGDLLSLLLQAQDDEGDGTGMSDVQVRDEAMTIFLAGHETTAVALTWTLWLLSQNPQAEAKLHAELDEVLAGRVPTVADLSHLPYTHKVLSESMRLYPPAYMIGRKAIAPHRVGGYTVPEGATVFVSPYVLHRDPRYWPNPETFDPERWTPNVQASRPRFAYFPFGGGPRICIGESFAWMEGELVLATLAQRWTMRHAPGHRVAPQPLITLRPKYGMQMTLHKR